MPMFKFAANLRAGFRADLRPILFCPPRRAPARSSLVLSRIDVGVAKVPNWVLLPIHQNVVLDKAN